MGGSSSRSTGSNQTKATKPSRLLRDALTGRVLAAENVTSSETEVMKPLLAPLKEIGVRVLLTISDAQDTLVKALEQLWPDVPHQACQFHALREASRPAFEVDRALQTQMRKVLQPKIKAVRQQLARQSKQVTAAEADQLAVLDDDALGVQTALNFDGCLPFDYPGVAAFEALDEVESSLARLAKKGAQLAKHASRS